MLLMTIWSFEHMMILQEVNLLAVLLAAIVYFILGGIWYSPKVFGHYWTAHHGLDMDQLKPPVWVYFAEFFLDLLTAYVLAVFISLSSKTGWKDGIGVAFWIWLGFVLTFELSGMIWAKKSFKTIGVNAGFALVGLLLMGAIIGSMQ